MSEATRAEREAKLAVIDAQIRAVEAQRDALLERICELEEQKSDIPELPEDREWRLAQMDPTMRRYVETLENLMKRQADQFTELFMSDNPFVSGSQWPVDKELKIKLPNGNTITSHA